MKVSKDINLRVVGVGKVGMSIIQAFAQAGFNVVGMDIDQGNIERGRQLTEQNLSKLVGKGKIQDEEKATILSRIELTTELDRMHDADVIIEAVFEDISHHRI